MFQLVPAIGSGANVRPDFRYALTIKEGANVCAFDVVSMQGIGTPEDLESYINEN